MACWAEKAVNSPATAAVYSAELESLVLAGILLAEPALSRELSALGTEPDSIVVVQLHSYPERFEQQLAGKHESQLPGPMQPLAVRPVPQPRSAASLVEVEVEPAPSSPLWPTTVLGPQPAPEEPTL